MKATKHILQAGSGELEPVDDQNTEKLFLLDLVTRLERRLAPCDSGGPVGAADLDSEVVRVCTGVALLLSFAQANWTAAGSPSVKHVALGNLSRTPGLQAAVPLGLNLEGDKILAAGLSMLSQDGEEVSVNTRAAHCLLLARSLMDCGRGGKFRHVANAGSWWAARAASLQQQLLHDCPSHTLDTIVTTKYAEVCASVVAARSRFAEEGLVDGHDIETLPHLELAVYAFNTKQRALYVTAVAAAKKGSSMEWTFDGALGVRTKYQREKKAQLIVRHSSTRDTAREVQLFGALSLHDGLPEDTPLEDDTLLPEVRMVDPDCFGAQAAAVDQALILVEGMANEMLSANDEALKDEELRAFTRLLTHQPNSLWCIKATSLWLRSKIESSKRRTATRSLTQLRSLQHESLGKSLEPHLPREAMFFGVATPTTWTLERSVAMQYCSEGMFDLAAEIFLKIQSWLDVIDCYTAINEVDKAESIVRTRLQLEPSARLWCALGELCERSRAGKKPLANDSDDAISCYKHALSLDHRYTHAHRCLAKLAYSEHRFEDVIRHLELALAMNPLSTPSWYTLGCTALQTGQWAKARKAFTRFVQVPLASSTFVLKTRQCLLLISVRAVQAVPDDGEGYANLAVALVRLKCKDEAYVVLTEGVKHAWTNWKVWQNYIPLCVDTGHFNTAIRALERMVDLKHVAEAIDIPVLSVLIKVRCPAILPITPCLFGYQLCMVHVHGLSEILCTGCGKRWSHS